MKTLETEILISASPKKVWSILVDFQKYPDWNPFIKKAHGQPKIGEKLEVHIFPPNAKEMVFKPTVQASVEEKEFSWLGHFLFPGIFDGKHIFIIESKESGCLFRQKENFSGLLVPLFWSKLDKDTRAGFKLMNTALKERAENTSI